MANEFSFTLTNRIYFQQSSGRFLTEKMYRNFPGNGDGVIFEPGKVSAVELTAAGVPESKLAMIVKDGIKAVMYKPSKEDLAELNASKEKEDAK